MEGSMVRRTQELLGRVIRKPPLTERLLSKPPFRYLQDVIGEVIRSTGFMKGLYTEAEMKSDNVKDKDAKIAFLQKAIDVVVMVTGESLAVKPARVVAGHEPERTNELLQAIAKCCLNKLSSDDAVQKVLAGEKVDVKRKPPSSKSQNKEIKESKGEEHRSHKEARGLSEIKDKGTNQDPKPNEELKEAESKRKEKDSDQLKDDENKPKNLDKDPSKEGEKHEKERTKNRMSKQGREAERSKDKAKGGGEHEKDPEHAKGRDKERKHEGGREKDRSREKDKERGKDKETEHEKDRERGKEREREKRRERGKDAEQAREHVKDKGEKKSAGSEESITRRAEERLIKEKAEPDKESESSARLSKQQSTKGARHRAKAGSEGRKESSKSVSSGPFDRTPSILKEAVEPVIGEQEPGESASDAEGDALNSSAPEKMVMAENGELNNEPPPQVNLRRLPRPSSARPAPPRIKRQESTEVLLPERNGSARIVSNVIIDKKEEEEEEDDQFVVEASSEVPELTEMATEATVELEGDEKHGGLVTRILETKKDYELSQAPKSAEKEKPLLYESARRKEKDLVSKEVEKFRGSIQALCRSALPLGKLMDYIQEDMDAIKNEYQMWKNENKQLVEALQKEQSITDSAVEPLKAKLAELDQLIRDEQDKICAKRATVLKNDEKIRKMILNINSRK